MVCTPDASSDNSGLSQWVSRTPEAPLHEAYADGVDLSPRSMEERGRVRRMNSSAAQKKADRDIAGEMPLTWQRGQDHFTRFTALIKRELDDETAMVEERWKTWSKQRLLAAGLALFDLNARSQGRFFGEPILVFENKQGSRLPIHRFGHGDIVLISRARPWGEKVIEGIVLDRGPTRIRVVVAEKPKDIRKGTWRLDRGANRSSLVDGPLSIRKKAVGARLCGSSLALSFRAVTAPTKPETWHRCRHDNQPRIHNCKGKYSSHLQDLLACEVPSRYLVSRGLTPTEPNSGVQDHS